MTECKNARHAAGLATGQHDGHREANYQGGIRKSDYNCSTKDAHARYSEREAERRKREARHRIERTQEQRRAARWFRRVEVMRRV